MSEFKYFMKINLVHKAWEGYFNARVQRQQPGAKTTEIEAPHGNLCLVCASTTHQQQVTHGQLLRTFQVRA